MLTFKSNPEQPCMKPIGYYDNGKVMYQLQHEDFEYIWLSPEGTYRKLVVKKGFTCDLASVPRFVYTLSGITPDGLIRAAAVLHDLLCEYRGDLPKGSYYRIDNGVWEDISHQHWKRKHADKLFARVMRECGVEKHKRRRAYLGVRAGAFFNNW